MQSDKNTPIRDLSREAVFEDQAIRTLCFGEVSSTMTLAREMRHLAAEDLPLAVVAKSQSAGRGRQGRVWHSTPGSLSLTYVFAHRGQVGELAGLSLMTGLAVSKALESLGVDILLKWPNDLCDSQGSKLGGILIEIVPDQELSYVLIGLGMNLESKIELDIPVTSLRELASKSFSRDEIIKLLHERLSRDWRTFVSTGFTDFRTNWLERALYRGETLRVETVQESVEGLFVGVGEKGEIQLNVEGKVRDFVSVERVRRVFSLP